MTFDISVVALSSIFVQFPILYFSIPKKEMIKSLTAGQGKCFVVEAYVLFPTTINNLAVGCVTQDDLIELMMDFAPFQLLKRFHEIGVNLLR
jgi:hypothetical protein